MRGAFLSAITLVCACRNYGQANEGNLYRRVARASRVLATTSRRRGLFLDLLTSCSSNETKIVSARRGNQHARRARYPEPLLLNYVAALAWLRCGMQYSSPLRATRNSRFGWRATVRNTASRI